MCTLSAIGEGEGFGDGLCLSMKLLATFSPSTSTGSSKAFIIQGSARPPLGHHAIFAARLLMQLWAHHPRCQCEAPSGPHHAIVRETFWFVCFVYKPSNNCHNCLVLFLLSCIYIATWDASAMQAMPPCKPGHAPSHASRQSVCERVCFVYCHASLVPPSCSNARAMGASQAITSRERERECVCVWSV